MTQTQPDQLSESSSVRLRCLPAVFTLIFTNSVTVIILLYNCLKFTLTVVAILFQIQPFIMWVGHKIVKARGCGCWGGLNSIASSSGWDGGEVVHVLRALSRREGDWRVGALLGEQPVGELR